MRKHNKKELILEAARELFKEKGYHAVTAEEISRRAGVGKGTIYQYFDHKQEIFKEMHDAYLKQYRETVAALILDENSFEENLRRVIHYHVENMEEFAQYGIQLVTEIQPAAIGFGESRFLAETFRKQLTIGTDDVIREARQRGIIREMDVNLVISCMLGMFFGVAYTVGGKTLTEAEKMQLEEQLLQMVLHGLAKEQAV